MLKGQSSTDLVLTIIIAIIFFSSISAYGNYFDEQSESAAVNSSLRTILLDVYTTVGSVKNYGGTIDYVSPKFNLQTEGNCEIMINTAGGSIVVTDGLNPVGYSSIELSNISVSSETFLCGEKVTISRT